MAAASHSHDLRTGNARNMRITVTAAYGFSGKYIACRLLDPAT